MRVLTAVSLLALAIPHASADRRGIMLQGEWHAVELHTAKGKANIDNLEYGLLVEADRFVFTHFEGTGKGKVVLDARAGRLDLVGDKATLYCAYRLDKGTLTLAIWAKAEARQAAPSTEKGGIVFVLVRVKRKLDT
jgi:hypothetical protein